MTKNKPIVLNARNGEKFTFPMFAQLFHGNLQKIRDGLRGDIHDRSNLIAVEFLEKFQIDYLLLARREFVESNLDPMAHEAGSFMPDVLLFHRIFDIEEGRVVFERRVVNQGRVV